MKALLVVLALFTVAIQAAPNHRIGFKYIEGQRPTPPPGAKLVRSTPYFLDGLKERMGFRYDEYAVETAQSPRNITSFDRAQTEVRTLVSQGPKENRINLTILGDGYTSAEKEKFFADAQAAVKGLFDGVAFASYLPLFNIYAVFVPSNVSGLGDGGPIDTVFQLYRAPKGSKRAIYPGDEDALEDALSLAPATDYPIVLANDDYYGGLGGRYAISTRSVLSGMKVLRHELGHNFGEVGEEYDNGDVYYGANASRSPAGSWNQWISGSPQTFEGRILSGGYVWQNLADGPYQAQFRGGASGNTNYLWVSMVGWETDNDVMVSLNGTNVPLTVEKHTDRQFNEVQLPWSETNTLEIKENVKDGDNVLGYAVVYSYPPGYDLTLDKVASFATFDSNGSKSYRPTHNSCIMRNMEIDHFCVVDRENFWHQFLARISLVDSLSVMSVTSAPMVKLQTLPLPGLKITWFEKTSTGRTEIPELANKTEWPANGRTGKFVARVEFQTAEVKVYNNDFAVEKEISL